ncbi:MAG: tRNA lysidine(34) synthetase TilS [Chlamydiales bacterium]|nr:tRNA lysidine(34) synthetase TilS [Chlamydiales bacterium]
MLNKVKDICKGRGPLLLALSGGPDSMALYHLLKSSGHPFEVAHIDHGWREESREEAAHLERSVEVPFHLKRLEKGEKNIEDTARKGRHSFFQEVLKNRSLEGVLLAHHADDLAETVLKRLLEGTRLTKLVGLEEVVEVEGMTFLRPLLSFRKKQIVSWLDEQKIQYFVDSHSSDLRSRMRQMMLPFLSEQLGKEVVPSLCRIAEDAKELREDLDRFMLKRAVSEFFEGKKVAISRPTLDSVCRHLEKGSAHKTLRIGKGEAIIDRNILTYNKRIDEE